MAEKPFSKSVACYIFINGGLFLLVCLYALGGVFLFQRLEMDATDNKIRSYVEKSVEIDENSNSIPAKLWPQRRQKNFSDIVQATLDAYQANVSHAIINYQYNGMIRQESDFSNDWAFTSALLFTITVVTTIGYGHVTPITLSGQLMCAFYALMGAPLMLMFLANIGDLMARGFRLVYSRVCCYFCWKRRRQNYNSNRRHLLAQIKKSGVAPMARIIVKASESASTPDSNDQAAGHSSSDTSGAVWSTSIPALRPANKVTSPHEIATKRDAEKRTAAVQKCSIDMDASYELLEDSFEDGPAHVPISLSVVVIFAYLFVGAVIFSAWNEWSWIKGAYFSFVTLATIGFGDLVLGWDNANNSRGRSKMVISICYIVFGLAVLSMCFNMMMEEMVAKFTWLSRKMRVAEKSSTSNVDGSASGKETHKQNETPALRNKDCALDNDLVEVARTGQPIAANQKEIY